ncbi:MAG: phosphate uptake regulator PhoU [Patescibacteria group bacterium]|nr:phosphate uptake regulator PhoU [Patescibacteria group bacterium]
MEIRKIQKTGGKSFSITLPKIWIKKNLIKNKDKIEIFDYKNFLIISPLKIKNSEKFISFDINNLNKNQIFREIIGYYISGIENIIIKAEKITYQQRSAVREISYKLIGCECLEGLSNKILLKIIIKDISFFINDYLKKMITIIFSMFEDTINVLKDKNYELANDIIERDIEIDRLHIAITRFHNIKLNNPYINNEKISLIDSHYYVVNALRIERIADHIVKINKAFIKNKEKTNISHYEKRIFNETLNNILLLNKIIFEKDKKNSHKYLDNYFNNKKNFLFFEKINKKNDLNFIIQESINRINGYIANIAEETINYSNIKNVLLKSIESSLIK